MVDDSNFIVARLVAERARLLRELIGIDTRTLETVPVFADWTAANLLAHIGDYDALFVERFVKVLEGKEGEIASIGDDGTPEDPLRQRNADLHARVRNWGLERSLSYLNGSRISFLRVLGQVSDEELKRPRQVSWGETSLYEWTVWRWKHDEGHARDLQRWRAKLPKCDVPGAKSVLLTALQAAMDDFLDTTALVPADEQEIRPICGTWTLKDVCGHMADWDAYFNSTARKMLGLDYEPLTWDDDWQAFNQKLVEARSEQSWGQVTGDFVRNSMLLNETLAQASEEALNRPYESNNSPYRTVYHCAWAALEHYLDHAAITRKELPVEEMPEHLLVFEGPYT